MILKQRHKEESIKLRYGSLYTVIDLLLRRGFIAGAGPAGTGDGLNARSMRSRRPAATSCATWMADLISEPVKEYPQFEAALCLLPVLPPDEALALLRRRL